MVIKRVIAYIIDILLVTFVSSMLVSISYINPRVNEYNKVYQEYQEVNEKYLDDIKKADENSIAKDKKELEEIQYRLDKNNIIGVIINVIVTIIYFVFFQKYNNGQTLGKKIMKIKIAGNLSLLKYFIRSLILYEIVINILKLVLILLISKENYILASNILYVGALVIEVTIIIMATMRKDGRGLHDLLVKSDVVKV